MSTFKDLKNFMMRGNVVDLAIGVIIGGAFGKIVTSLVGDIIMPPIGYILGGVDFTDLKFIIGSEAGKDVSINYGSFFQTVLDFIIISSAIFFAIKGMNKLNIKTENAPAPPSKQESLLTEIRDLLKEQNKK